MSSTSIFIKTALIIKPISKSFKSIDTDLELNQKKTHMKRYITLKSLFQVASLLFVFQLSHAQTPKEEQEEMLRLVNELRLSKGRKELQLSPELNAAAQVHSEDMAKNNFIGHSGSDNSNFSTRIRRKNYPGSPVAENVAAGNSDVKKTFDQWVNSIEHYKNMLLENPNKIGIGHAYNPNAKFKHYWTQVFGKGELAVLSTPDFAISDNEQANVFPNPAVNTITITLPKPKNKPVTFNLTDSTGKIIEIIEIQSNQLVTKTAIDHIPSGLYFLTANGFSTFKMIKI